MSEGLFQSLEDNYGLHYDTLYFGVEQISCYLASPAVSCRTVRRAYKYLGIDPYRRALPHHSVKPMVVPDRRIEVLSYVLSELGSD